MAAHRRAKVVGAILLLAAGFLGVDYLLFSKRRLCETLEPGIVEADLVASLGTPHSLGGGRCGRWLLFPPRWPGSDWTQALVVQSKEVGILRCREQSPPTWHLSSIDPNSCESPPIGPERLPMDDTLILPEDADDPRNR